MRYIEADRWVLKIFQHIDINFNKKNLINLYSDRLKHLPIKTNFNSSLSLSLSLSLRILWALAYLVICLNLQQVKKNTVSIHLF